MSNVQGLKLMKEYVSRYTEYKKLEDRVKIDKSLANPALSEKLKQEINTLEKKIISEISFDIYDGLFSITKEFFEDRITWEEFSRRADKFTDKFIPN
ncbi:hypothetical protein [Bacillus velezensis]|uniref:hypothetical protein n=1 Tax=Bacillus velezensis TaxID=492670 RepID=UPI00145954AD|nr:hypothetical protein [Bacillus velezensis]NME91581.1 PCRF domain-containing protein [Bacillus velezensis]NMW10785.1 hypothetical protein [Bacillus velezensis]